MRLKVFPLALSLLLSASLLSPLPVPAKETTQAESAKAKTTLPPMAKAPKAVAKADKRGQEPAAKAAPKEKLTPEQIQARKAAAKVLPPATPTHQLDESKLSPATLAELKRLSELMREQNQAIFNELKDDEETAVKDIAMLWQAAVERSGTIRYAIEKLSRRDATGKPVTNDSFTKRVLQSAARVGGVAGSIWTGTPAGILGGNMVEEIMRSDPTDPSQLRVTDADMLILAKEVDALQSQVIETYYQYRHTQERWKLSQEAIRVLDQARGPDGASVAPELQALLPVMDSLHQSAQQDEASCKQAFVNARNALGLLVGGEALVALEQVHAKQASSH